MLTATGFVNLRSESSLRPRPSTWNEAQQIKAKQCKAVKTIFRKQPFVFHLIWKRMTVIPSQKHYFQV